MRHIPYDRPYVAPHGLRYVEQICARQALHGNGALTQACQQHLQQAYGYGPLLLTTSCTHTLEMAALLLELRPGDEVIVPSFTFPATATAFALRGATLRFADSLPHHPNIDPHSVAQRLTPRTRAVVVVHYAGMAADLPALQSLCAQAGVPLIEDAAHALHATYNGRALGTFGRWGALSFGSTKNISAGKGGALVFNRLDYTTHTDHIGLSINIDLTDHIDHSSNIDNMLPEVRLTDVFLDSPRMGPDLTGIDRQAWAQAECLLEVGTNKRAFSRGEVDKYQCVSLGSSYYIGELCAAFLLPQLQHAAHVTARRRAHWQRYHQLLQPLAQAGHIALPQVPPGAQHNAHIYYIRCQTPAQRDALAAYLKARQVGAVFHYQPLHASAYFGPKTADACPQAQQWADCLLRLPLYYDLTPDDQQHVVALIEAYYKTSKA